MAAPFEETGDEGFALGQTTRKVAGAIADVRPASTSDRGAAGVWLARALFRILRPYAWRTETVHESVLEALRALDTAIERMQQKSDELSARVHTLAAAINEMDIHGSTAAAWIIPRIGSAQTALDEPALVVASPLAQATEPPPGCSRVETHAGGMWVIDRDTVITSALRDLGTWEPEFGETAARYVRPGMTVIDVGANIGFATRTLAGMLEGSGTLIAIEPEPLNFRVLCSNAAEIASSIEVHCVPAAASDRNGELTLWLDERNLGDHRTWRQDGVTGRAVKVPGVRIDDLIDERVRVDFVKIDTQGSERQVLEGMRRIIERWRPTLYVEFWPFGIQGRGDDPETMLDYYHSLGFTTMVPTADTIDSDHGILDYVNSIPDGYIDLLLTPA